jgi:hypothetical protein
MRISKTNNPRLLIAELLLLAVVLVGQSVLAQDGAKQFQAAKFVVSEKIRLKDSTGNELVLNPGILGLQNEAAAEIIALNPFEFLSERRGGDGQPPRGPVFVSFKNDLAGARGILELNFAGAKKALFWLDEKVDGSFETYEAFFRNQIKSSPGTSGQEIGLRMTQNSQLRVKDAVTLLLLETDTKPIADIELMRGGDHGDPR